MKKFIIAIATVILSSMLLFSGCTPVAGKNGRDGIIRDVSIYEIFEAVNEERVKNGESELEFLDFIAEYLNYSSSELETLSSTKNTINRSLLSGVAILSRFSYTTRSYYNWESTTTYSVALGSGVIIDLDKEKGDAYIVTNCHVIYDNNSNEKYCEDVRLYLYGQDTYGVNYFVDDSYNIVNDEDYKIPAKVVGASITYDIALLKVEGSEVLKCSDAQAAQFSSDEDVYVGEYVYAIGNGSGEGVAATEGIISRDSEVIALNLMDTDKESDFLDYRVLRTDAAVNGGNSGGALYNKYGKIVGIVNAKSSEEGTDNMGYALPASMVKRVVDYMISAGESKGVKRATLGIYYTVDDTFAYYNEEKGVVETREQISVNSVMSGSAAESAGGLEVGDTILTIAVGSGSGSAFVARESLPVTHGYTISNLLLSVRKGDTVKLTVRGDNGEKEVYINYVKDSFFSEDI